MEILFLASIILFILYLLFVKGFLWKLIIAIFGWIGMNSFLESKFYSSKNTFMTILNYSVSWSIFIPTLIIILAMATTSVKE